MYVMYRSIKHHYNFTRNDNSDRQRAGLEIAQPDDLVGTSRESERSTFLRQLYRRGERDRRYESNTEVRQADDSIIPSRGSHYVRQLYQSRRTDAERYGLDRLNVAEQHAISEQDINQLQERMPSVFRNERLPFKLLSEEKFTTDLIDQTLRDPNPALKKQLGRVLSVPESHANDQALRQTALAFSYASEYVSIASRLQQSAGGSTASGRHDFSSVANAAMSAVEAKKEYIIKNPERDLFLKIDMPRMNRNLDAGFSPAPEKWRVGNDVHRTIQSDLQTAAFETGASAHSKWEQSNRHFYQREVLDLSSFGLTYRGKSIKTLEKRAFNVFSQENSRAGVKAYDNFRYTKITMSDGAVCYEFNDKQVKQNTFQEIYDRLTPFLAGSQYEKDLTHMERLKSPDVYWQGKELDWRLTPAVRESYYKFVHPTISDYTRGVVNDFTRRGKHAITIVDIAGGNGDLAERIINDVRSANPALKLNYRLVDYSAQDVATANERFRTLQSERINAVAMTRDMLAYGFDAESMKRDIGLPRNGVDIVINSGGLLNHSITDDPRTSANFNTMYSRLMAPGGFGIYSGLTPLLVNAQDHASNGMRVHNLHDINADIQLHVVRRSSKA